MENDPKQNLADKRFDKVDLQFQTMQTMFKEEMFEFRESMRKEMFEFRESMRKDTSDFKDMMRKEAGDSKESMRKDMYKFAGFLTVTVISAIGVFGAFVR